MKRISESECIKIINKYISNKKLTQALLIDGPWGCGKSYFISQNEDKFTVNDGEAIHVIKISLYGKDSLESIQSEIYSKLLGLLFGGENEESKVKSFLAEKVPAYAFSIYKDMMENVKLKGTVDNLKKDVLEMFTNKINDKLVFIFDDFERCRINIFELMGYMNDLSENQGHKVIIVANESEIHRSENDIASAIRSGISYNDLFKYDYKDVNDRELPKFREELENRKKELFDLEKTYEKTREKLVGITVHFQADIESIYDELVKDYVGHTVYGFFLKNKEHMVASFNKYLKGNIRTCISVLIAAKDIISIISNDDPRKDDIVEQEKLKIVDYIIYSASRRANGEQVAKWSRPGYGFIDTAYNALGVFGYSFVDDYWDNYIADETIVKQCVNELVEKYYREKLENEKNLEHANLALFKLEEWYKREDEEVTEDVELMKRELEEGKYFISEFSRILTMLININNPQYRIPINNADSIQSLVMYDTINDVAFCADTEQDIKELLKKEDTDDKMAKINIEEFVDLMVKQADRITMSDINFKTSDIDFARKYNFYAEPLVEIIYNRARNNPYEHIAKINMELWDQSFIDSCEDSHNTFWSLGKFLSYFDVEKIYTKIEKATTNELYNFDGAISKIYDDANGLVSFTSDIRVIIDICKQLENDKENQWERFNEQKSRTKGIVLNKIKDHFEEIKRSSASFPIESHYTVSNV